MSSKNYTLVAWTEKGNLRMVPSLVNVAAEPYKERIERLEAQWEDVEDEIGWLLARSRAHERFARFLLSVGYPREAYEEYRNAAMVCAWCSDGLWLQGEACDFPALPLLYRFLSMHRQCVRLAMKDEFLRNRYKGSDLEGHYLFFTLDDQITDREFSESYASMRAWRFGKAENGRPGGVRARRQGPGGWW
ncbi:MAG: hypothetical protein IJ813_06840 [Bacteroidales bacterium]|nr:hypothetical protein [Bacteroidales bacterium]